MSPLAKGKSNIGKNIRELKADNKKSGTAKGANGTPRPMKQIIAIALSTAMPKMEMKEHKKESKKEEKKEYKKGKK